MSFTKKQEEEMEIDLKEIEKEKEEQIRRDERERIIKIISEHIGHMGHYHPHDGYITCLDKVLMELGGEVKIGDSRGNALKLGKGLRRPIVMPKPEKIFMEDGTPRCPYCHKAMHNVIDKSGISKYIWECDCPRTKDLLLSVG